MHVLASLSLALLLSSASTRQLHESKGATDYFWQVTDFHLDQYYGTPGPLGEHDYIGYYDYHTCWNESNTAEFGHHDCDSPMGLVTSAVDFMKAYKPTDGQVKFILWTGDDTVHCDDEYASRETVVDTIGRLSRELNRAGLPVLPVQGNHDVYLSAQFPGSEDQEGSWASVYADTAEVWRESMLTSQEALLQFQENYGAYIIRLEQEGWQSPWWMVGLNTNLFYKSDHLSDGVEDPGLQLSWLRKTLTEVRAKDEGKVLLFAHIAPGTKSRQNPARPEAGGSFYPSHNEAYLDIIEEFADIIEIQLYGHEHNDGLRLTPGSLALMAPSVTPWDDRDSSVPPDPRNPGLRLFQFDQVTGQVVDYQQFFLNLTRANLEGEAVWELEYSFLDYYGLEDMQVSTVAALVESMEEGGASFNKYFEAGSVQAGPPPPCGDVCVREHYCGLAQPRYPDYTSCLASSGETTGSG